MGRDDGDQKAAELPLRLFAQRIRELRVAIGLSGRQLAVRLGKSSGVVSQWEQGHAVANRDEAVRISARYGVSLDSLFGLDDGDQLEPSPILRRAQVELRGQVLSGELARPDVSGRIQGIGYHLIEVKAITPEGWNDWVQVDDDGWEAIMVGKRTPMDPQIRGAAMLAGWYEGAEAWSDWISYGRADDLAGYDQTDLVKILDLAALQGVPAFKVQALVRDINK